MGIKDATQQREDTLAWLWRQVGKQLMRGQSRIDARFDRLETRFDGLETRFDRLEGDVAARFDRLEGDVAGVKTDIAGFKTDVAARFDRLEGEVVGLKTGLADTTGQLNRLELATMRGFDRVEARLEELARFILREEEP